MGVDDDDGRWVLTMMVMVLTMMVMVLTMMVMVLTMIMMIDDDGGGGVGDCDFSISVCV